MTDQQLFDAYRSAGPDQIFRIGNRDALQPEGSDAAQRILGGAQRFASDGARIAELLQQVVDDDKYVRSKALANLRLLGDVGAAEVVDVQADGEEHDESVPGVTGASHAGILSQFPVDRGTRPRWARRVRESGD